VTAKKETRRGKGKRRWRKEEEEIVKFCAVHVVI